jgi:hypothetical protein
MINISCLAIYHHKRLNFSKQQGVYGMAGVGFLFSINYFIKTFVIDFMDRETINLYSRYEALSDSDFQSMSIQELFDYRHGMLELLNKFGALMGN